MIRTIQQQQEIEEKSRLAWLNSIVESGMYLSEASKAVGMNPSSLHRVLEKRGLKLSSKRGGSGPRPDTAKDAKCIALVSDGLSVKEIADEMGISGCAVSQRLKRLGVKAKRDGRAPIKTSKTALSQSSIDMIQHLISKTKLTPDEIAAATNIPVARIHQLARASQ